MTVATQIPAEDRQNFIPVFLADPAVYIIARAWNGEKWQNGSIHAQNGLQIQESICWLFFAVRACQVESALILMRFYFHQNDPRKEPKGESAAASARDFGREIV